jgi:hypothetical protein
MSDEKKAKQARLSEPSLKLIRMFAGELQLKTGKSVSDAQAVFELFKNYRPDLIALMEANEKAMGEQ